MKPELAFRPNEPIRPHTLDVQFWTKSDSLNWTFREKLKGRLLAVITSRRGKTVIVLLSTLNRFPGAITLGRLGADNVLSYLWHDPPELMMLRTKTLHSRERNMRLTPFHLAIQVRDIAEARDFYGAKMGLSEGRSDRNWIDWNMFGHQVVTHLNPALGPDGKVDNHCNPVDAHAVPVPHFGVVLEIEQWKRLADRVRTFVDQFIIEPYVRFEGQPGEQYTMFFADPSGNALEFKAFANIEAQLFAPNRDADG